MSYIYSYHNLKNINLYDQWNNCYHKDLQIMYSIFIKHLKNNYLKYKDISFDKFCEFIFSNSSKLYIHS